MCRSEVTFHYGLYMHDARNPKKKRNNTQNFKEGPSVRKQTKRAYINPRAPSTDTVIYSDIYMVDW